MIPYGKQSINKADIRAVIKALSAKFVTTGPLVDEFEKHLFEKVKAPTFVVNSGTAALHCAYFGVGIGPGDEVITPPNTFVATQATAINLGAKIVFADVELATGLVSIDEIAKKITNKTKAIVLVDYAGQPCDVASVRKLIAGTDIKIIQDAAHSLGSTINGQPVGALADVTTFSFFPTKNITTGEGGAVSTLDDGIFQLAKEYGRQGLVREATRFQVKPEGSWHQEVHHFGLNYRLTDFQCALGISQLKRIEKFKEARKRIFETYSKQLSHSSQVRTIEVRDDVEPMWHLFPIRVPISQKKGLYNHLRSEGYGVQVNYFPAYWHPAFKRLGYERGLCPNSELFYQQEISLPIYVDLSLSTARRVAQSVIDFLAR